MESPAPTGPDVRVNYTQIFRCTVYDIVFFVLKNNFRWLSMCNPEECRKPNFTNLDQDFPYEDVGKYRKRQYAQLRQNICKQAAQRESPGGDREEYWHLFVAISRIYLKLYRMYRHLPDKL